MSQDEEKAFNKLVGIRLRWARKEAGVTAAELGEVVGVSERQYRRYEAGSSTLYLDRQGSGPKIKTAASMQSFQGTSEKKVCVNWPVGCRVMPVFLWCTKTTGKHRLYNVGISNGMALIRHRNY